MSDRPRLILMTGVMAAGKSSVAQSLAKKYPRSVHLRGDAFRRFVVNGRVDMGAPDSVEALDQLRLRYQLSVQAALAYYEAGFTVVHQDVILGALLADVVALYNDAPVEVIVLCPSAEVIAEREHQRRKTGYGAISIDELQQGLRNTPPLGRWVDSSDMTIDQTANHIKALIG